MSSVLYYTLIGPCDSTSNKNDDAAEPEGLRATRRALGRPTESAIYFTAGGKTSVRHGQVVALLSAMSPAVLLLLFLSLGLPCFAQERALTHDEPPLQPRARVALVVGNAAYAQVPLTNPPNDARAMADTLTELGFTVELAIDADRKKLGGSIDRFTSRLRRGDVAVFFYAGHGMQVENENYLL